MANHGYVYTKQELTYDEILKELEVINQRCLGGLFEIKINGERNYITIWCKKYFDICIQDLWLSDEREFGYYEDPSDYKTYIEYDQPKILSKNSVIEFRHGHGNAIYWLEGVFRENIAKKYDALIGDDGYDERYPAKPEEYESFEMYAKNDIFWDLAGSEDKQLIANLEKEIKTIKLSRKLKRLI